MPVEFWCQHNIVFRDRDTAIGVMSDFLGPALDAAMSGGLLRTWWFMSKQPLPLRYVPAGPDVVVISRLLDQLVADGAILIWESGIYEPETLAFGGDEAMDAAHLLFHQDSRHLLTRESSPAAGRLGRRETAVLLCSAMMRAAGLDLFEQADVWAKVAVLRPAAAGHTDELVKAMRHLMMCDAKQLCDRVGNGPLAEYDTWVDAFEQAGKAIGDLARHGKLTRGLRAVLAHHVIFCANRAGLSLDDQAILSALAMEAVMETRATHAERLRHQLVDELVSEGRIRTPEVEEALRAVPRHLFVPGTPLKTAYENTTVSIKQDETGASISCASQPGVVAVMLEQLRIRPGGRVLEIGAGTGYNAALLARLTGPAGHVTTVDVDEDLVLGARSHLEAAGVPNVCVVLGDGALGHAAGGLYDRIIATVGAHGIPPAWMDQLAPGGRLVVPQRLRGSVCRSIAYERDDGVWRSAGSEMNTFMPLRRGIADDGRHLIPLTSTGLVTLQTRDEHDADPDALAGVLDQPGTVTWSGVLYQAMESPEWMELWLTCTISSGLNQMPAQPEAEEKGLLTQPYRSSTAAFDKGALTYLTRRLSAERTPDGGKLWEFGVVGHGEGSGDLAAQVLDSMRTWDREYRSRQAQFEIHPSKRELPESRPGRFCFRTPLNQFVIDWTSECEPST